MQYGIIKSEFWSMFKKVVEKEKKNDEKISVIAWEFVLKGN